VLGDCGMVGGIGVELMEQIVLDPREGQLRWRTTSRRWNLNLGTLDAPSFEEEPAHVNPFRRHAPGRGCARGHDPGNCRCDLSRHRAPGARPPDPQRSPCFDQGAATAPSPSGTAQWLSSGREIGQARSVPPSLW